MKRGPNLLYIRGVIWRQKENDAPFGLQESGWFDLGVIVFAALVIVLLRTLG